MRMRRQLKLRSSTTSNERASLEARDSEVTAITVDNMDIHSLHVVSKTWTCKQKEKERREEAKAILEKEHPTKAASGIRRDIKGKEERRVLARVSTGWKRKKGGILTDEDMNTKSHLNWRF